MIYHLTTPEAWDQAQRRGEYRASSLDSEGFIHASTTSQLAGSANRFFQGIDLLAVLAIDPARLRVPLVWEKSSHHADPFPHLYGPLNADAVVGVHSWRRSAAGSFALVDLGLTPAQDGSG